MRSFTTWYQKTLTELSKVCGTPIDSLQNVLDGNPKEEINNARSLEEIVQIFEFLPADSCHKNKAIKKIEQLAEQSLAQLSSTSEMARLIELIPEGLMARKKAQYWLVQKRTEKLRQAETFDEIVSAADEISPLDPTHPLRQEAGKRLFDLAETTEQFVTVARMLGETSSFYDDALDKAAKLFGSQLAKVADFHECLKLPMIDHPALRSRVKGLQKALKLATTAEQAHAVLKRTENDGQLAYTAIVRMFELAKDRNDAEWAIRWCQNHANKPKEEWVEDWIAKASTPDHLEALRQSGWIGRQWLRPILLRAKELVELEAAQDPVPA